MYNIVYLNYYYYYFHFSIPMNHIVIMSTVVFRRNMYSIE